MSSDRDILIERLEKELYERDKLLRDARESIDRLLAERERGRELMDRLEVRLTDLERRVADVNNKYEGVMMELLDQKSLIQAHKRTKPTVLSRRVEAVSDKVDEGSDRESSKDNIIVADDSVPPLRGGSSDEESDIIEI
ncbi:hypothetical protein B6V01_000035 [Methanosarcinales archaeon ex4572_44]|nr:MAG: hypothetical protein B6U67_01855 [Methanosarcinales archaeon ex4484_138]PHP46257.1 MAG: hypothetical protein B6V01_000035 [Methanosarcinales archaeon ex4572_44]RLG25748.1 MAG: hypothetical protein DRN85_04940 [Methanosarcinales archaeon]RLG28544.1 MAG: hypothetical protein DRN70_00325 [Methanosarcinales archaeon]